jgi:hypothetical protein
VTPGALDADVGHGYCLRDIRKLAGYAAHRSYWVRAMPAQERFDLALSAIAESVLTAQERPGEKDLVTAGIRAINRDVTVQMKLDGVDASRPADDLGPNMANFCTYWFAHYRHVASHENAIVEAIAVSQILPRLKPANRDVILALATHGTYDKAAASLGIVNRHTFIAYLSLARKEFLSLWHEGQTPSRIWGKDCFGIEGYDRTESITVRTLRQRKRKKRTKAQGAV